MAPTRIFRLAVSISTWGRRGLRSRRVQTKLALGGVDQGLLAYVHFRITNETGKVYAHVPLCRKDRPCSIHVLPPVFPPIPAASWNRSIGAMDMNLKNQFTTLSSDEHMRNDRAMAMIW